MTHYDLFAYQFFSFAHFLKIGLFVLHLDESLVGRWAAAADLASTNTSMGATAQGAKGLGGIFIRECGDYYIILLTTSYFQDFYGTAVHCQHIFCLFGTLQ